MHICEHDQEVLPLQTTTVASPAKDDCNTQGEDTCTSDGSKRKPTAPFLLTAIDYEILSQTDDDFQPHTWEDLKLLILNDEYARIKRYPSDLSRYVAWSNSIKADPRYGSSVSYIMKNLLHWTKEDLGLLASPLPLVDERDFQVLLTEWPYAFPREGNEKVSHFVVWMKHFLETGMDGKLTAKAIAIVNGFVMRWFGEEILRLSSETGRKGSNKQVDLKELDAVQWGKAQRKFMTVPGVEHFHVFVRHMPDEIVKGWVWSGSCQ